VTQKVTAPTLVTTSELFNLATKPSNQFCHLVTTLGLFRIGPSHLLVNFLSFCSQNLQMTPMYGRHFRSPQCNPLLHPSRHIAMSPRAKRAISKTMQRQFLVRVANRAWSLAVTPPTNVLVDQRCISQQVATLAPSLVKHL
jgi:hypothetical protein